jgi:hypothetical protein
VVGILWIFAALAIAAYNNDSDAGLFVGYALTAFGAIGVVAAWLVERAR